MTTQLEIDGIAPPSIATPKGRMKCSSLRPGDWLLAADEDLICVLINSRKLQRVVIRWEGGFERSYDYETIALAQFRLVGHGKARKWWDFLPKFLRNHVCPYSQPSTL